jgi:hypothetical protein
MDITFDINGLRPPLSERGAEMIAENLHNYALGPSHRYSRDVALLTRAGVDPEWIYGARALADVIEDTLVGRRNGPIPLDANGKAAEALVQALRLTGPASFDATSEHAVLLRMLRRDASGTAGTFGRAV